jgi:hypothetical protein
MYGFVLPGLNACNTPTTMRMQTKSVIAIMSIISAAFLAKCLM